jgi:membrane protease subunit HflK
VENPEATLRSVTQAVYRRVAAANPLDAILTYRKDDIQREVLNELREISNFYRMGIEITAVQLQEAFTPEEVREAFIDVSKALEEREQRSNEAQRYRNERIPVARGQAIAAIEIAEAYRARRVNEAHGTVARYKSIEEEYRNSPDIMRTRMYLEMIREVMPRVEKVYFLDSTSGSLLEILHLGQ